MNIPAIVQQALNQSWIWVVAVAGIWFLWKVPTWKAGIEHRLSNVEKSVDKLESSVDKLESSVDKLETSVDKLESSVGKLENSVGKLSEKVNEIYGVIINKFGRTIDQADSPVILSDYGKDLYNRIDAEKIVDRYAERLLQETKGMNAYQIQEHCFLFSKDNLLEDLEKNDKESFETVSDVAYMEGIDLEKIMRVVGIPLRDRVLSMQGKSYTKVDDHSPVADMVREPTNNGDQANN